MTTAYPHTPPSHAAPPVYATLVPFPFVSFTLALFTDIAFWQTANLMWQNFSSWLLFAGLVFGGLGLLVGAVEMLVSYDARARGPGATAVAGYVLVLLLAFWNSLVHAGDGWTAIVPYGLVLSAITVVLIVVTTALARATASRRIVGRSRHA